MTHHNPWNAASSWRRAAPLALVALVALAAISAPSASAATQGNRPAGCIVIDGGIVACGAIEVAPCANSWTVVGAATASVTWTLNGHSETGTTFRASGAAQDPLNSRAVGLSLYANGHLVASYFALGCRTA